ncbi:type IX secretion system outer membrane channel protein PorV [Leeuwenhoekiella sp. H156]|uniref:type IX secretion system outer membrane channel protein PorV n=1 Tax=Leeuwenhoekiella sp. H156 TaxID=3450128 RepID=UPI003FA437FB
MNKFLLALGFFSTLQVSVFAQEVEGRPITTGVPFLAIAADARAAGLGDQGVATRADAYSQQWNPAKYAFIERQQGVGFSYTPYLNQIVDDIFLGQITYYNRINDRSAFAGSFRYFGLGDIESVQSSNPSPEELNNPLILSPNEFTLDVSYALRLGDRFAMSVTGRYLRSDLKLQVSDEDASAAGSIGVDIAGFYQSEQITYNDFDGRWRGGFNISNIGPKIKYDEAGQENFLPTNLRLGGGFDFILDPYNVIGVGLEFNKLLVPSPQDFNNDGVIDGTDAEEYQAIGFLEGMFQSFGDAPNGFSEELKEVTWSLGAEYKYDDVFAFRMGYFNESDLKGARKFGTLGLGFKYTSIDVDVSYLFSTSQVRNPLENTLRLGLTFSFGEEYTEY